MESIEGAIIRRKEFKNSSWKFNFRDLSSLDKAATWAMVGLAILGSTLEVIDSWVDL